MVATDFFTPQLFKKIPYPCGGGGNFFYCWGWVANKTGTPHVSVVSLGFSLGEPWPNFEKNATNCQTLFATLLLQPMLIMV